MRQSFVIERIPPEEGKLLGYSLYRMMWGGVRIDESEVLVHPLDGQFIVMRGSTPVGIRTTPPEAYKLAHERILAEASRVMYDGDTLEDKTASIEQHTLAF